MPPRDPRAFLADIRDACAGIMQRTIGREYRDYESDESLRLMCERLLGIAGEAVAQLRKSSPELASRITSAERIVGFRNILIHGYYMLANDIVWAIITTNVPSLRTEVEHLLQSLEEK